MGRPSYVGGALLECSVIGVFCPVVGGANCEGLWLVLSGLWWVRGGQSYL